MCFHIAFKNSNTLCSNLVPSLKFVSTWSLVCSFITCFSFSLCMVATQRSYVLCRVNTSLTPFAKSFLVLNSILSIEWSGSH